MASSATVALASASDYATAFNAINRSYWSGSVTIFPVQTFDGRKLWISGLAWSGALSSAGARTATTPKIVNTILEERQRSILPYAPAFTDANGYGHLFDSRQMINVPNTTVYRVEPIAGISLRNALYLTVRVTSDFTSWAPTTGSLSLIEIPLSLLNNGMAQISQSMPLPTNGSLEFGTRFSTFDADHVYVMGRQGSAGVYSLYWARIPIPALNDFTRLSPQIEYFSSANGGAWSSKITDASSVLDGVGPWANAWYTGNANYNYLYQVGNSYYALAQKTLQRASTNIRYSSSSVVNTVTPDPLATGFALQRLGRVPWANLSSGKQLGFYTNSQTSAAYEQSNPLFTRPKFFEFSNPAVAPL